MSTMLDFYRQHGISPVKQDTSDLSAHFARRANLYRALGLWPNAIRGKSVLEVGPGTGENALYTISLRPSNYSAVEPNPVAATHLLARCLSTADFNIMCRGIEAYPLCFHDVVLCEGLLGLCGGDPKALLEHVARHVTLGGVLVITCIDPISDHAEVLRRALAHKVLKAAKTRYALTKPLSLDEKVEILRPVFAPHLATLKGMTRNVDDWMLDNLLNPASIGRTFSIPEALSQLEGRFTLMGASPNFFPDWRWYKEADASNQWAIDAYWANCHNLLDCRDICPPRSKEWNEVLMGYCTRVRADVARLEQGEDVEVSTKAIEDDPAWFGRGQQYLSFVRVQ